MLQVQEYLTNGKSLEDLQSEFGLNISRHPNLPLVILNYDQIESRPKSHPIIRECRGLVLNTNDWSLVARSFPRFFNWGELQDEMNLFDFSNFTVESKEDGSLVLIYYFDGKWHTNTRGSFAFELLSFQNFTWRQAFCKSLNINDLSDLDSILNQDAAYVCEFVSPWNKIVRQYSIPEMYLLTAFVQKTELSHQEVDALTHGIFKRPKRYEFTNLEEIQNFLFEQTKIDPTFEGVVIRDHNGLRFKIKSPTYLGLHRLKGEGDNLFNPKYLLPFVLSGEKDELLTYYPEVREAFELLNKEVENEFKKLEKLWLETKNIKDQKEFALAIKGQSYFIGLLFEMKRDQKTDLRKVWNESSESILKFLKQQKKLLANFQFSA